MRNVQQIIAELNSLELEGNDVNSCDRLASELENMPNGSDAIQAVLGLFERHPEFDFGTPGSLVHAIERYYGHGYEQQLIQSIERSPTCLTMWLANRIANAGDTNAPQFVSLLRATAERTDIPANVVAEARHFVALHKG